MKWFLCLFSFNFFNDFFEACVTNLVLGVTKVFKSAFVGLPVIKTLPCNAEGVGSIPGQGAKIPHTLEPNIKQEQYCNKFNKRLKKINTQCICMIRNLKV